MCHYITSNKCTKSGTKICEMIFVYGHDMLISILYVVRKMVIVGRRLQCLHYVHQ